MLFDRLFRRRKKHEGLTVPRSIFLKAKPIRNPLVKWEKDKKKREIKLRVPLKPTTQTEMQKQKKTFMGRLLSSQPEERIINLDKIGSVVWGLCDGEKTIGDIANYLVEKYKLMLEEAEISLNAYFSQLSRRGLVGFILPEEAKDQLKEYEQIPQKQ